MKDVISKVVNPLFFYSMYDGSIFADVNRMITLTCAKFLSRDRFGYFNKFSDINWTDEIDNIPKIENDTLSYVFDKRCENFIKTGHDINIMYSGGVDSTAVVSAFVKNCENKNKLKIYCTEYSIREFPDFYEKYKREINFVVCSNDSILKSISNSEGIIVSGSIGGNLFCTSSVRKLFGEYCNKKYEISLKKYFDEYRFFNDVDEVIYHLNEYNKMFGNPAKTLNEITHLLIIGLNWSRARYDRSMEVKVINKEKSVISFYDSDLFCGWVLNNLEEIDSLDQTNSLLYKKHLKDYIFGITKLNGVYDLVKVDSWKRERYLSDWIGDVLVLMEDGSIEYHKFPQNLEKNKNSILEYSNSIKELYIK